MGNSTNGIFLMVLQNIFMVVKIGLLRKHSAYYMLFFPNYLDRKHGDFRDFMMDIWFNWILFDRLPVSGEQFV